MVICEDALPYLWNGNSYNATGTYTFTTLNAAGCDSVATLELTVNELTSSVTPVIICEDALPYLWNGNSYNATGTYTFTTLNAAGCDSVATLELTVNELTESTTPVTICEDALPYLWNGNSYNATGTYTFTTLNAAGCDSVATLELTVNELTESTTPVIICEDALPYLWNGTSYNATGTYTFTTT